MTYLLEVVDALGLEAEVSPLGRWARFPGQRGLVYVLEVAGGCGYYTWGDAPGQRDAQPFRTAKEAIAAGLRRAMACRPAGTVSREAQAGRSATRHAG